MPVHCQYFAELKQQNNDSAQKNLQTLATVAGNSSKGSVLAVSCGT